jgi:ArsR family transcriptional regulator, arsenate/arsenite/antimonite-responsive transcriptional repressor / arsenate reductase (thioredoxin)
LRIPNTSVIIEAMNAEADSQLERRARVHAALGDPGRLRIVDALSLGDASPTDLQHELGMTSNLLAHHLKTLEIVGLVTRHRSEGDRRRTYLRLDPDSLAGLLPDAALQRFTVPRVVFVCTANTARSQLAAALWAQASSIPVASAGTHPADAIAPGATAAARRHGLKLTQVKPRGLDEVLQRGDYVITVCDNAHEELDRTGTLSQKNTDGGQLHWSVPDPVPAGTSRAFDAAYDDLTRRVIHLAPRLAVS